MEPIALLMKWVRAKRKRNISNSKDEKRKDILNDVSEWLQAQKKRELKNESELSQEETKKN